MILQLNDLHKNHAAAGAQEVIGTLYSLLEEGLIEQRQFTNLRVHLDWIQYRQNFREPVTVTREASAHDDPRAATEMRIDTRQVSPGSLREEILRALTRSNPDIAGGEDRVFLEDFKSFRSSI